MLSRENCEENTTAQTKIVLGPIYIETYDDLILYIQEKGPWE